MFNPCIPRAWQSYQLSYQHETSRYEITIENPNAVMRGIALIELDDVCQLEGDSITLKNDGQIHQVRVVLG
ncbi:MAG: hypothetical protein LUO95_13105 [Methylococcaceae bacterium]|nr:hypothetical protein [Methylococcaceae bacterium]